MQICEPTLIRAPTGRWWDREHSEQFYEGGGCDPVVVKVGNGYRNLESVCKGSSSWEGVKSGLQDPTFKGGLSLSEA